MRKLVVLIFAAAAAFATIPADRGKAEARVSAKKAQEELERARQVASDIPAERLLQDRALAKEALARLDRIRSAAAADADLLFGVDYLRSVALLGLDRNEEALRLGLSLVPERPAEPLVYGVPLWAAYLVEKPAHAVTLLESAARHVTEPAAVEKLRSVLSEDMIWALFRGLHAHGDKEARYRTAAALVTLEWPSPDRVAPLDHLRVLAAQGRLAQGDAAGAKGLVAAITTPRALLALLVARRHDRLFDPGIDRLERLQAGIAAYDEESARRLATRPDDLDLVLERAQFLRGVGREDEALALLLPIASDMKRVAQGGDKAFWIVNEAAYSLVSLGRPDEGVKLMQDLLKLDMARHSELINMAINHGEVLNSAGRHKEAAQTMAALHDDEKKPASEYGKMWIWSSAACAHALQGDAAGAAPWLDRLSKGSKDNQAAHTRALICLNRLDEAEQLIVKRLSADDADDMLVTVQDYRLGGGRTPVGQLLEERWRTVIARPAVQEAVAKKGRVLTLPLSKTYWGEF